MDHNFQQSFHLGTLLPALVLVFTFALAAVSCASPAADNPAAQTTSPEAAAPANGPTATPTLGALVWSDEFDGPSIDTSKWGFEVGYIRNSELQYYTDNDPDNAYIENGNLVIEARQENMEGFAYTSASLNTKDKFTTMYGRIEMRAKLPYGKGIWPAFWTLGADIDTVNWPTSGEIDIMELIGGGPGMEDGEGRDDTVHGTIHWQEGIQGHQAMAGSKTLTSGIFADDYHVFAIDWTPDLITWYLDGVAYTNAPLYTTALKEQFGKPHFILLNLAIGGSWPGSPNAATVFPQKYYIDYVRVYAP